MSQADAQMFVAARHEGKSLLPRKRGLKREHVCDA
jgi:hypothetical protein